MSDKRTEAERLAARILASGPEESMRELLAELDRDLPRFSNSTAPDRANRLRRVRLPRRLSGPARGWRALSFVDPIVDGAVVLIALGCIIVGARPLTTPVADARPALAEALGSVTLPTAGAVTDGNLVRVAAIDRRDGADEPIGRAARDLDALLGRYREVAQMNAERRLPCAQLRRSYEQVQAAWIRYSLARRAAYAGSLPDNVSGWDAALYEGVREVDRGFTASGCRRP